MKALLNTTAVQNELILNHAQYNIDAQEFVCICQMLTLDPITIDLITFLRITQNNKPNISSLATKNILTLREIDGKMMIDLTKLYELLSNSSVESVGHEQNGLSAEQIERLIFIFGRKLHPNEIMKINSWLSAGATFAKIEEAIYSALSREISNLNYIEKIIINNNSTKQDVVNKESSIKRNWTY